MKKLTIIIVLIVCVLFAHIHAVYASTGYASIESIKTGDKVLAANPETGEQDIKTVVQTFVNETDELVHVTFNGETITTTPEHPFYAPQKGWTGAIYLRAGDMLVLSNGEYVVVEKVEHELLESPALVYNFEVEDLHTYYVSAYGVLVHNSCNHGKEWAAERRSHWKSEASKYDGMVIENKSFLSENGLYEVSEKNLDRMRRCLAPKGIDGRSVQLHHNKGILIDFKDYREIFASDHQKNFKALHSFLFN